MIEIFNTLNKIDEREEYLKKIGETEETLLEMALVGTIDDTLYIKIYGGEGPVPHFHFYSAQDNRKGCIKILEASYFIHGNNLDTLKRWEVKELVEWLQEECSYAKKRKLNLSNWECICMLWDQNNPEYELENPSPNIPDYSTYL